MCYFTGKRNSCILVVGGVRHIHRMHKTQLLDELEQFGLSRVEACIYLFLLDKQPKSILEIARDLNLPRTSVYDNSVKLSERGLVQKIIKHKSQKLKAYPLKILQDLIDKERTRIDTMQESLTDLEEQLRQQILPLTNTEVRYYHGRQGFQQLMWNSLEAKGETIGYSEFGRVEIVGEKFAIMHAEEMLKRKIKDRVLTNSNPEMIKHIRVKPIDKYRNIFQETRVLDETRLYVSGDTTIYNNVFAVCYWKQGEVVGVEIENEELVKTQKSIFEELWKLATPIEEILE